MSKRPSTLSSTECSRGVGLHWLGCDLHASAPEEDKRKTEIEPYVPLLLFSISCFGSKTSYVHRDEGIVDMPTSGKHAIRREPDWGVIEIAKLVLMGFLWGAVVLVVIHGSRWMGMWWDKNIGTPGRPRM